jgi:phospholipid/cholesterol/gamma-HCH transport system substrate-binding protein
MIQRLRDPVNLGFFVLVAIAVTVWLFVNHVRVGPAAPRMNEIRVEFEESPGIGPGFPVTYLGIGIGKAGGSAVGKAEAEGVGIVVIDIQIDPALEVPDNVQATVRRRSAVGEPYLDLHLPEGEAASSTFLQDGDTIHWSRTVLPPTYEALFERVEEVLAYVDTDDLNTLLHETALGLGGRAETVRLMLDDLESIGANFAGNVDLLDDFFARITQTTRIFASRSGQLTSGFDDLVAISAAIRDAREDLLALIDDTAPLQRRTTQLLREVDPAVSCLLPPLSSIAHGLDDDVAEDLRRAIAVSPRLLPIIAALRSERGSGTWIRANVPFSFDSGAELAFDEPLERPTAPPIRSCPAGSAGSAGAAGTGGTQAGAPGGSSAGTAGVAASLQGAQLSAFAPLDASADVTRGGLLRLLSSLLLLIATSSLLRWWLRPTETMAGRR